MICEIVHDEMFLRMKSRQATSEDLDIAKNLCDTMVSLRETCAGLAANMIGERVRILAFFDGDVPRAMLNAEIVKKEGRYNAVEGCLSLAGQRECVRYKKIKVKYQDMEMKTRYATFVGFPAQVIQHECDHFEGIII